MVQRVLSTLLRWRGGVIVIGIFVFFIGNTLVSNAHIIHPVEVDGTLENLTDIGLGRGGYYGPNGTSYDHTDITLQGNSTVYIVKLDLVEPQWGVWHGQYYPYVQGDRMQLWIDQGTTNVVALTVYRNHDTAPAGAPPTMYTTDEYRHPEHGLTGPQTVGRATEIVGAALALGGLVLAVAVAVIRTTKRIKMR